MTRTLTGIVLLLVCFSPPFTDEASASIDATCAREELLRFTDDAVALPGMDAAAVAHARETFANAPDDVVLSLHATLEKVEGWRELPRVAADLSRALDQHSAARLQAVIDLAVAGPGAAALPGVQAESRREILLSAVGFFRALTPLAGAESDRRWAEVQMRIEAAPAEHLPSAAKALANGAADFRYALENPGVKAPGGLRKQTNVDCNSYCCEDILVGDICLPGCTDFCGWLVGAVNSAVSGLISGLESAKALAESTVASLQAEINGYLTQITNLTNQIAGFVSTVGQFVTDAFNKTASFFTKLGEVVTGLGTTFSNLWTQISTSVTGFFDVLKALVPTTPEAAFHLATQIDVNSTAWVDTLVNRFPILEAPCPAYGTDAGPLGIVGTLAAAQKSDGLAKVTKIVYDVAPSDVPGIKVKLLAASIYHPAEYWNLCARSRYAIHQFEEESSHRSLLANNLNVQLSTRGTQSSVNALGVSLADVDADVTRTEGKFDLLAPKTDELLRRLDQPLSTRAKQTSVDALRGSIGTLDADVARVEGQLDVLQTRVRQKAANQTNRQTALASFEALMMRLDVEDNLLENDNNTISLFQLPNAFGGKLELVRTVVHNTFTALLAAGQSVNNAQRDFVRAEALFNTGQFAKAYKEYRKSYTEAVKP